MNNRVITVSTYLYKNKHTEQYSILCFFLDGIMFIHLKSLKILIHIFNILVTTLEKVLGISPSHLESTVLNKNLLVHLILIENDFSVDIQNDDA